MPGSLMCCEATRLGKRAESAMLCRHFAEPPPRCEQMCDVCQTGSSGAQQPVQDCTPAAQAMLRVLEAAFTTAKHATLKQLLQAWHKDKVRCCCCCCCCC